MPIEYATVYQITQLLPDWPFACIGLLPFIGGAVVLWGKRRFKWAKPHWLFAVFLCVFGVMWVGGVGSSVLLADWNAYTAYQNGDYRTVEGTVYNFHPMPYEGHQDECFSVEDQRFCYSDFDIAPGFHNATSHGGPIRSGLPVRIAYRDGRILRLDIPKDQTLTPAESAAATFEGQRQWQQRSESDPVLKRMNTAFLFTMVCWTLWWNLQWKLVMRFWVKPPYRSWVEVLFRIFFAANFFGAVIGFIRQLLLHPLARQDVLPTIQVGATMCSVVAIMSAFGLWMAHKRDTKRAEGT